MVFKQLFNLINIKIDVIIRNYASNLILLARRPATARQADDE
jgi:hypothetical protein